MNCSGTSYWMLIRREISGELSLLWLFQCIRAHVHRNSRNCEGNVTPHVSYKLITFSHSITKEMSIRCLLMPEKSWYCHMKATLSFLQTMNAGKWIGGTFIVIELWEKLLRKYLVCHCESNVDIFNTDVCFLQWIWVSGLLFKMY